MSSYVEDATPGSMLHVSTSPRTPMTIDHDWDVEAKELLARLNIETTRKSKVEKYRNADAVYRHPTTGAKLYIGNMNAARSEAYLMSEEIYHVVNCQDATSRNYFENDPRFTYVRFPVAHWSRMPGTETPDGVLDFFEKGCHLWIDDKLEQGRNVLIHCLAGAHRAGCTGVSYMMRVGKFDVATAIHLAKFQRPIVDPFGQLLDLLHRLEAAYLARGIHLTVAASVPRNRPDPLSPSAIPRKSSSSSDVVSRSSRPPPRSHHHHHHHRGGGTNSSSKSSSSLQHHHNAGDVVSKSSNNNNNNGAPSSSASSSSSFGKDASKKHASSDIKKAHSVAYVVTQDEDENSNNNKANKDVVVTTTTTGLSSSSTK